MLNKISAVFFICAVLAGCASEPEKSTSAGPELPPEMPPVVLTPDAQEMEAAINNLQTKLGLTQEMHDENGFVERQFDSCQYTFKNDGTCGSRYLTLIRFHLVCRETVETAQEVSASLTPLAKGNLQWRLGGTIGQIRTDSQGHGQVHMVSTQSLKAQRLILILGTRSLGLEAGEVSQIVLPADWCSSVTAQ